ncbi:MAG TPA: TlyA family RNA methyltransferase [Micromonosporaceae bacterium]|nr:TlyA family RNA methyltransferase [Micromonosporaceae bacterium]
MARRIRLDAELVRRGLARSREQAADLVAAGRVEVRGTVASKVAAMVDPADALHVRGGDPAGEFVSRGGHKLAGALAAFVPAGLRVAGRRCLDAGASTGGFTDVLLRAGAVEVVAVDVGYGQLAWPLRNDVRVRVHERTNVRTLTPVDIGGPADLVVTDLSFISLRLVLDALVSCLAPGGDLVPMVKPQFEVGRERVGAGGVVRDPALRADVVLEVAGYAAGLGLGVAGVVASPLPGPSGNVEFFLWLRRGPSEVSDEEIRRTVEAGVAGPGARAASRDAGADRVDTGGAAPLAGVDTGPGGHDLQRGHEGQNDA